MKYIPVMKPYFDNREIVEIKDVLTSGWVAQGPKVAEFEKIVAQHEGVSDGIATTSCTTALHLLLVAMGLGPEHEILVPSYTFIATANAVEYTGATPVFVDVETNTYNIDVRNLEKVLQIYDKQGINIKSGKKLFGVVVVNLFGLAADLEKINEIANQHNIMVIEDSACALGAKINGVSHAAFGNPSCLSFHPRKSITTGEGGMILTADQELAEKCRKLRSHAAQISEITRHQSKGYLLPDFDDLGFNYRMNDIQAAVGVAQMEKFDEMLKNKIACAQKYDSLLADLEFIKIPYVPKNYLHTYQSYVCMIDYKKIGLGIEEVHELRNMLMSELEAVGIATRQGTHAVHMLGYYAKKYNYKARDFLGAYECDRLSLAIPLYYGMTNEEQVYVVEQLKIKYNSVREMYEKNKR